ncbi:sugar ABC transporter permease [Actinomadura darangshiensis]|uniref:Sugar ABC transporter permease n=1 Tax=Actinomadura darangshiensis TaxID=705336 RepID=A0A4R5BQB2_9ACTN|nr:sugar ABC transporter permease [Actinomadura darangshiensis]
MAPYLFIAAAAVYLLLLTGAPLLDGVWLSFTDTQLLNPTGGVYTGTGNYSSLFSDSAFVHSLLITVIYSAATVIGALVVGTTAAVAINGAFRGRALARAILTFPWAVPTVAAALIFAWIYNKDSGVLNHALSGAGLGGRGWLVDPTWSLFAVTLASVWKVFPFVMLVVLAALQSVPDELYEAARVDGADALNRFRTVALPFLMPTLRVTALLMTIWSFRRFEVIWLLTQGGPVDSTNALVINVYREAFVNSDLGRSAAMGVVGLVLSTIVTVIFFYVDRGAARKEAL